MTRQEIYATYLLQKGCKEVIPSKSRKYRQFLSPKGATYWLGKSGAIRSGKAISKSFSLTNSRTAKSIIIAAKARITKDKENEKVKQLQRAGVNLAAAGM